MAISVYGDISWRVGIISVEKMLAHAEPIAILNKLALNQPVPKNKGSVIKWRRPVPWGDVIIGGAGNSATGSIAGWTAPVLTEGVPPASTALAYDFVTAQLTEYGAWKGITDVIYDLAEDPVLEDQVMLAGENAGEVMELVTYNVLRAGTNVVYLGGGNRAAVKAPLTLNAIRAVTRTLRANRAKPVTKILGPSSNISTRPVESSFVAVCHSDCDADIRNMTGFVPVAQYGTRQPIAPEELGSVETVRFITSPLFAPLINAGFATGTTGLKSTSGANIDVYPVIVFGQDAFGITPLKGFDTAKIMVLNPDVPRGGDPLGQQGSVGWKSFFAVARLAEMWMARIECGVSSLA